MKLPATITLAGKSITVRKSKRPLRGVWGYAKHENIVLSSDLPEDRALAIMIHEAMHLLFWFLSEETVDHASKELAEALEILDLA